MYETRIAQLERALAPQLEHICHELFTHPELGLEEYESVKLLMSWMVAQGFSVENPWYGLETGFAARWGEEGPCIAFLAEYDALPGYGPSGCDNGHACGHNWIAAVTCGAAAVVKQMAEELELPVRILLAGCPAEETFGAKSLLAREGAFDGVDCALHAHLSDHNGLYHRSLALTAMEIRYFGKASHASSAPWEGINALDALQLYYAGVAALRQQLRPDVRLHGVIREGGKAANSIPERASCLYYARAAKRSELDRVVARLHDVAKGAALMTGARLEITTPEQPMDDLVQIPALQAVLKALLTREGLGCLSREEADSRSAGSTDVGNVSHICPTAFLEIGVEGFDGHREEDLAVVDEKAYPALHKAVRILTEAALRVAGEKDLRDAMWREWNERTT